MKYTMQIRKSALLYFALGVMVTSLIVLGFAFKNPKEVEKTVEVTPEGRLQYKWFSPPLPQSMYFAGEKVPLHRSDIREQLDRELLYNYYNQYSTIYILKLAGRYFPLIEPILKANGIPDDFKYLCIAESALQNQISKAGAVGFWQFMPKTAPEYGLEISDDVDERYHVQKSTEAACKYFKTAYKKFGSWTAAAASYNMGMGGYNAQASFQQTSHYYDMLLPEETMRYIFRILAFKQLIGEAERFGYVIPHYDQYKPVTVRYKEVTTSIPDLAAFAIENGTNYRTLKQMNPWLRSRKLTVKPGKVYKVSLPVM